MTSSLLTNVIVELHVPDFEAVKQFYEPLGFKEVWQRPPSDFKGYLVMKRDQSVLCFWPGNDCVYDQPHFKKFPKDTPRGYGVEIIISVTNIDDFYRTFTEEHGMDFVTEELIMQPWGTKDFRAVDPNGYYLRFNEPHDISDSKYAID